MQPLHVSDSFHVPLADLSVLVRDRLAGGGVRAAAARELRAVVFGAVLVPMVHGGLEFLVG